jgi:hypothetical protein
MSCNPNQTLCQAKLFLLLFKAGSKRKIRKEAWVLGATEVMPKPKVVKCAFDQI